MTEPGGIDTAVEISAADRSDEVNLDVDRWSVIAAETLAEEGVTRGELGLTFVGVDEMSELNSTHMGKDGPTDVLAFPLDGLDLAGLAPGNVPVALGDVVICVSVARSQAAEHCGTVEAELALLVIHGVLHVLGHDHYLDEERVEMQGREQIHMQRYGFRHPEFTS